MLKLACPDCGNSQLEIDKGVFENQIAAVCPACGSLFFIRDKETEKRKK